MVQTLGKANEERYFGVMREGERVMCLKLISRPYARLIERFSEKEVALKAT